MMRIPRVLLVAIVCAGVALAIGNRNRVLAAGGGQKVALEDDCDPTDPAWAPQGCFREEGHVTRAEFNALLFSPLIPASAAAARVPVGHPSWRIDPGYLIAELGENLRVRNAGGRGHTFTEVAQFGGGFVPPLNGGTPANPGIAMAPECNPASVPVIAPGGQGEVSGLALGVHRFQCCIHPWMRAAVKVVPES
jgi:hypothetical protein